MYVLFFYVQYKKNKNTYDFVTSENFGLLKFNQISQEIETFEII